MQYCSSQHWTLLSPPGTPTTEHHFSFGPAASFILQPLVIALCASPVAYWTPSDLGAHLPLSYLFAFSSCSWGSCSKNTGVVCHSFLQWITVTHPSQVALHSMAHSSTELHNPFCHDKAVIYEGDQLLFIFVSSDLPQNSNSIIAC